MNKKSMMLFLALLFAVSLFILFFVCFANKKSSHSSHEEQESTSHQSGQRTILQTPEAESPPPEAGYSHEQVQNVVPIIKNPEIPFKNEVSSNVDQHGVQVTGFCKIHDKFFDQAYADELKNEKGLKIEMARSIDLKIKLKEDKFTGNFSFGEDSIYELIKLLKEGENATANTAANPFQIGGEFATDEKKSRNGLGAQEEGMMACFRGLFKSLIYYGTSDPNNKNIVTRDNTSNMFKFDTYVKDGSAGYTVLIQHVLYSPVTQLRVAFKYFENYAKNKENHKYFTNYLIEKNSTENVFENDSVNTQIGLYTMAGVDLRLYGFERNDNFYRYIRFTTRDMIGAMLVDAKNNGKTHVVVTIPGIGDFAYTSNEADAEIDYVYLEQVKYGAALAIKLFGSDLNIIVCGLKDGDYKKFEDDVGKKRK